MIKNQVSLAPGILTPLIMERAMWALMVWMFWAACPMDVEPPLDVPTDSVTPPTEDSGLPSDPTTEPSTPTKPATLPFLGELPDTCAEADAAAPLADGRWLVTLADLEDDLSPNEDCFPFAAIEGAPDGVGRVEVAAGEAITVSAEGRFPLLFLTRTCEADPRCLAAGRSTFEPIVMVNDTTVTQTLYVGVESWQHWPSPAELKVERSPAVLTPLPATCNAARMASAFPAGTYYDRIRNDDPTLGQCGRDDARYPGRIVPVDVPAGFVLSATSNVIGIVSILEDCTDPALSCLGLGSNQASWVNSTDASREVFVMVEQVDVLERSDLRVELELRAADLDLEVYEDCAAAEGAVAPSPGEYQLTLDGPNTAISGDCGSPGRSFNEKAEAYVPIDIPPNTLTTLSLGRRQQVKGYWAGNCVDPGGSCFGAANLDGELAWANSTDATVRRVAVLAGQLRTPGIVDVAISDVPFTADAAPDTCAEATVAEPIRTAGTYTWDFSDATDAINLRGTCLSGEHPGSDRIVPIEVPARTRLVVEGPPLRLGWGSTSVSLVLMEDCAQPSSCVDWQETTISTVDFVNDAFTPQVVYLVVDGWRGVTEATVDVDIRFEVPDAWVEADTCLDPAETLVTGTAAGTFADATDQVVPSGAPTCSLGSGPERFAEVTLAPGERLDLEGDGVEWLYLLDGCDELACVAGVEVEDGRLSWLNEAPFGVTLTVVAESPTLDFGGNAVSTDFALDVRVVPSRALPAADDCLTADSLAALSPGTYHFDLADYVIDAVQIPFWNALIGSEAIVPVEIPAETEVRVDVWADGGVYPGFLADCADHNSGPLYSVGVAGRRSGVARWFNPGPSSETAFLVLDTLGTDVAGALELVEVPRDLTGHVDACVDLGNVPVLTTGSHRLGGDRSTASDAVSVSVPDCVLGAVGDWSGGPDRLVQVELQPGERLFVAATDRNADLHTYLLEDCSDPSTCLAGWTGLSRYHNQSGAVQRLTVVVDGPVGGGPFTLDIDIE